MREGEGREGEQVLLGRPAVVAVDPGLLSHLKGHLPPCSPWPAGVTQQARGWQVRVVGGQGGGSKGPPLQLAASVNTKARPGRRHTPALRRAARHCCPGVPEGTGQALHPAPVTGHTGQQGADTEAAWGLGGVAAVPAG